MFVLQACCDEPIAVLGMLQFIHWVFFIYHLRIAGKNSAGCIVTRCK